jgi:cell division protein FtsX
MSRYIEYIAKKHSYHVQIEEARYEEAAQKLPKEDFSRKFFVQVDKNNRPRFYEIIEAPTDAVELNTLLLDKIYEDQKTGLERIKVMAGIMLFYLLCNVAVIAIVLAILINAMK